MTTEEPTRAAPARPDAPLASPAAPRRAHQPTWRLLPAVLTLAFAARVAVVLAGDFIYHPDVVFQYLEPAWRLVSGYGLIFWEQYYGARPQLVPVALAGVLKAFLMLGIEHPSALRTAVEVTLCGVSLLIPWGMYALGRAAFDERVGRVACVFGAVWYEFVALAGQPLSETLALGPLLWMFALAAGVRSPAGAWGLGLLAVATCALRLQFAPLTLLAALLAWPRLGALGLRRHALAAMAAGMVALAAFDLATVGMPPYRSYVANALFNLVFAQEALALGADAPWYFHLLALTAASGGLGLLAVAVAAGGRGYGAASVKWLLLPLALVLATHAFTPWKEYRHVLAVAPLWLIALAVVCCRLWDRPAIAARGATALAAIWFACVTALGSLMLLPGQWAAHGFGAFPLAFVGPPDPRLTFADRLADDDSLTGLAEIGFGPGTGVGHVHLGRPAPIYDDWTIRALRACGVLPRDFASHAIIPPDRLPPPGFAVTRNDPSGWRLAERIRGSGTQRPPGSGSHPPAPPPRWAVPGPVTMAGPFASTARTIFDAAPGAGPWPVRVWQWWEGTGARPGPLGPFRVHGPGARRPAPSRVPAADCGNVAPSAPR